MDIIVLLYLLFSKYNFYLFLRNLNYGTEVITSWGIYFILNVSLGKVLWRIIESFNSDNYTHYTRRDVSRVRYTFLPVCNVILTLKLIRKRRRYHTARGTSQLTITHIKSPCWQLFNYLFSLWSFISTFAFTLYSLRHREYRTVVINGKKHFFLFKESVFLNF